MCELRVLEEEGDYVVEMGRGPFWYPYCVALMENTRIPTGVEEEKNKE